MTLFKKLVTQKGANPFQIGDKVVVVGTLYEGIEGTIVRVTSQPDVWIVASSDGDTRAMPSEYLAKRK
jgi:hypothetical protein